MRQRLRRQKLQRLQQPIGVFVHRQNMRVPEDGRKRTFENLPIFEHVRHAGRAAHVVFEHVELAVAVADQIGAGDMRPDSSRRRETHHLAAIGLGGLDQRFRDDFVFEDFLVVVNIGEKQVERHGALFEAALEHFPVIRFNNARNDVKGENFFSSGLVTVNGKGDARLQERRFGCPLACDELARRQCGNPFCEKLRPSPRFPAGLKQLVKEAVRLVVVEIHPR